MNTVLSILACGLVGGVSGALFSVLLARPRGRRRGAHRSWWQRPTPDSEAETAQLPVIRDNT